MVTLLLFSVSNSVTRAQIIPLEEESEDARLAPGVQPSRTPVTRSVSSSEQFIIYGKSLPVRGQFCVFCEGVKTDYLSLLGISRPDWESPIVLRIHTTGGKNQPGTITTIRPYSFGGWLLQLDVHLDGKFSKEELEEELVRLLLAEQILRGISGDLSTRKTRVLPDWLHRGVLGMVHYRRNGRPSATFQAVWKSGVPMPLDDILDGEYGKMDSMAQTVFDASASALVHALHQQQVGRFGLRDLTNGLSDEADEQDNQRRLLSRHFPDLQGSSDAIDKWWTLEIANLADGSVFETLSAAETERLLKKILVIEYQPIASTEAESSSRGLFGMRLLRRSTAKREDNEPAESKAEGIPTIQLPISELRSLLKHPQYDQIVRQEIEQLMGLSVRAFPLYAPIVRDYQNIFVTLGEGKRVRNLDGRLEELEAVREHILQLTKRAEHFLDYCEASKTRHVSSEFDDYLRVMESFQQPPPARSDPISGYLDSIESEWK